MIARVAQYHSACRPKALQATPLQGRWRPIMLHRAPWYRLAHHRPGGELLAAPARLQDALRRLNAQDEHCMFLRWRSACQPKALQATPLQGASYREPLFCFIKVRIFSPTPAAENWPATSAAAD